MDERKYETRRGTGRVKASTKSEKSGGVDAKSGKEIMPRAITKRADRKRTKAISMHGRETASDVVAASSKAGSEHKGLRRCVEAEG